MHGEDGKCNGLCGAGLLNGGGCRSGTQGRWLEGDGGSKTKGYGNCCDVGSDVENGVTPIKTRLLRKGQSYGLYRRHKCTVQVKCSTSISVLYK